MVDEAVVSSVNWLQVTVDQLKSGVSKVDLSMTRKCCNLYLSHNSPPKIKQESAARSRTFPVPFVVLIWPLDVELLKIHLTLFPYNPPAPEVPRRQLVEGVLKEEFGREISDQLPLPPYSERKSEKQKQVRRENQITSVVDARETRDTYIKSWPQPVPEDVVLECINVYYEGTQLKIPPTCSVCAR